MTSVNRPWLLRPVTGPIRLKLPYELGARNRHVLQRVSPKSPHFPFRYLPASAEWEGPRRLLLPAARALAEHWGWATVLMHVLAKQRCDIRCQSAKGPECVCSCGYAGHGGGVQVAGWVPAGPSALVSEQVSMVRYEVYRAAGPS